VSELHATGGVPVTARDYAWVPCGSSPTIPAVSSAASLPGRRRRTPHTACCRPGAARSATRRWSACAGAGVADHALARRRPAAWKQRVWRSTAAPHRSHQIRDPDQVVLARYGASACHWHGDRIVFLGDAAH
jgi:hypothetical protein